MAKSRKYGVVREFVGHGIGTALHEEPQVPNYGPAGQAGDHPRGDDARHRADVQPRTRAAVTTDADGWTVRTKDGKPSAHFEHTVVATAQGPVVLGFGRYAADSAQPGAPGFHEYPLPVAV